MAKPMASQEVIDRIEFSRIDESPFNPRKTFDEKRLNELALSISQQDITSPLIVRAVGKRLQIVFGARRFRAAKIAKPNPPIWSGKTVPAIIREYTDEQVKNIQLTENLQREDLHPMEEAEAYEEILKHPDYNIPKLAARQGKELSYITKRLQFLQLITPVRKLFVGGDIGWEQAVQFCRMIPKVQENLFKHFDNGKDIPRASEIASIIEKHVFLDLSTAPFDITDATLSPQAGACVKCSKQTGFNRALFDEVKKGSYCLDRPCFNKKVDALITIKLTPAKEKDAPPPPVPITSMRSHLTAQEKADLPKGTLTREDNFTIVKKKGDCKHTEDAIIVHHDGKGQAAIICRAKDCKEHADQLPQTHRGTGENLAERAKRLQKDRDEKKAKETRREILITIGAKVSDIGRPELQQACRAIFNRLYNELQRRMLKVLGYMRDREASETWEELFEEGFSQLKGEALNRVLVMLSLAASMDGLPYGKEEDILMVFAARLRVNTEKIAEEVAAKYDKTAAPKDAPAEAKAKTKKAAAK